MKSMSRLLLSLAAVAACATATAAPFDSADQARRDRNREEVMAKHGLSSTDTTNDNDFNVSGFQFMARGGLRIFPGKEFSIDPWLGLSYFTGGWEQENEPEDLDGDASGFELMVNLTLSGWM